MNQARRLVDMLRALQPPDKSLGQHFLVLDDVLNSTVEWAEVTAEDHVLEVGPGPGVLTEVLCVMDTTVCLSGRDFPAARAVYIEARQSWAALGE